MEKFQQSFYNCDFEKNPDTFKTMIYELDSEKLKSMVKKVMNTSKFPALWDFLLKSLQESSKHHDERHQIVLAVLNELEEKDELNSHITSAIIQRVCMDLTKYKMGHLVDLCNFCLKAIRSKTHSNMSFSWKELLPDILRILSEQDLVEFSDLEYSGTEFKATIIDTLCMYDWNPDKITQITAMFSDMPLNKEEHFKIVTKLTSYLEKLTPHEVPPFIYQLLRLCRFQNTRTIFLGLQNYFGLRIYHNSRFAKSSIADNTPDFDLIENADDHNILETENTVLYHIQAAASIGHNGIRDYLNSLKNVVKSPDFILHPFQLLTLLTISTVGQYEESVFDVIRHSVVKAFMEEQKQKSSHWYRDIISSTTKPEDIFEQIMNLGDREFLLEAFANFGFALLSVGSALGRDPIAEKQWNLGTLILLKIIKKRINIASIVLKMFCNHILTRHSAPQYIECLYYLSKSSPLLMIENQICVTEMMENIMQIPSSVAINLLDALTPLTKVSATLRDQFILILRKCLYSRSIETRQVAVHGYVKLISILQFSNGGNSNGILSQTSSGSFSSGFSLYTQISMNRTTQSLSASAFSTEAICWEVLGILKRCLMQQAPVRLQLYEDLYTASCINPGLNGPALDVLWLHFMDYYIVDEECLPPLHFENVTMLRDTDCTLQEPIGKFIFLLSQIVNKIKQTEEESENASVKNYTEILDSLSVRMSKCELVHFELDDGTDLTDILPESQQKMYVLKEVLNVYEALIGYKISSLRAGQENQCGIINSLFDGYTRFLQFGKNLSKPKKLKKGDKMSQKDEKTTQKTQTQQSQSFSEKRHGIVSKNPSKVLFKGPDSLLDLAIIDIALKTLLQADVEWVMKNDATTIRTNTALHRHFFQAAAHLVLKHKSSKLVDTIDQKNHFENLTSISSVIYAHVIQRLSDYIDFDCTAAVLAVECFHSIILLIIGQYKHNVKLFLSKVGGQDKQESLIEHLKPIIEQMQKLFETDENELSADPDGKRLPLAILGCIASLSSLLPSESNAVSLQLYDWLKKIAYEETRSAKLSGNLMNLLFETHIRYKSGLTLLELTSESFKDIFGTYKEDESLDINADTHFKIVNAGSGSSVILSLCSYIKTILEDVESIIARVKCDYTIINFSMGENIRKQENLKSAEKGVTCQLCFVANILTNLVSLQLPAGNLSDAVFKNVVQFYSSLSSLTKYFINKSTKANLAFQGVWFEKLVKRTGKMLAPAIYMLLYHRESAEQDKEEQTQGKHKSATLKNKVLKETKLIPKVVYEMEQFSKFIIQLSKKTKYDLSKYVGQGTTRGFRIKLDGLQILNESEEAIDESIADNDEQDIADEEGSDGNHGDTTSPADNNQENLDPQMIASAPKKPKLIY
ncbi:Fanconi anemia group I protein [Anthonomus grandis grandis]|uniref:Fanconi anemia group I protein n=1 Tax=Anthonomus grandis grandis TaxID=2921223 RepID=UPI0021654449|nr:Fanconi anemia group I protein [Anthonomus grandis grandis]